MNLALYEGAQQDITSAQYDLKRARGRAPELAIAEGDANSELAAARTELEKNRSELRDLKNKLAEKTATNAISEKTGQANLQQRVAAADISADQATADRVLHGGTAPSADAKKLIADASRIAGHQVDLQTAAKIIENGASSIGAFMLQVNRLATALSTASPGDNSQLESRVTTIESQLRDGSRWR